MCHNAVRIRFLIVLIVVGALAAFTLATSEPATGRSVPSASERHYDLGDGRYVAIVPADTYNQEAYIDTYVDSFSPGTDHCTDSKLEVEYYVDEFGTRYRRAYLGFHLSSIPANAVVTSATFYAYLYDAGGDSSVSIRLRRITSSWGCPRTWNNKPPSTGYVSRSISSSSGWKSWPVTSLVQNYWIGRNFGASPNFGLELRGPESGGASRYHWRYFRSKNAGSNHPYLVVIYQLPSPTPTRTRTPTRTSTPTRTLTPTPTRTPTPSRECDFPLVVNNTDDVDDEACDGTHCSLREAILCANDHRGPDVISFDIPDTDTGFTGSVWLIAPHSALPELTDAGTTIDGPSQAANRGNTNAAGPEIVLSGASAGASNGLYIRASDCEVRGLDIGGFELSGILLSGTGASNNTIADNFIGVAADGAAGFGNDRHGVEIVGSARSTQVNGNVISGNNLAGIWVGGTGSEQQNVISENRIGTNASGTAAIPNRQGGVQIMHGAHHNTVGPDNVISGNGAGGFGNGVSIGAGSDRNTVIGNRIGTDAGGTAALPNGRHGVDVAGSEQTVVEGNLLSGNTYSGIKMYGGGNNQVRGNIIGLNADGTAAVPNSSEGFIIEDGATNITVGGATAAERNVISGNGGNGIGIKDPPTAHITILGNYIGTDVAGSGAIPNGANGLQLFDHVHDITVGPGNVIAHNTGHGLYLFDGAHTNVIGPDNVIASNGGDGVRVDGQDTLYNTITQNSIYDDVGLGIENINGGNTELPPPAFTDFTVTEASGTATLPGGAPCAGCTIEVFSDDGWEGRQYLGSGTTLADGSWTVTFAAAPTYGGLTATSTDTAGNTSEFSSPPVSFLWPDVEVDKELIEPPGGVAGVGEDVAFRITIRNSGTAILTGIGVSDAYPSECLLFTGSDPMPDTVDPVVGELTWDDVTTHFGDLDPGGEISLTLHFRVIAATCDLGPLAVNCTHVEAQDSIAHVVEAHWCDDVTLEPGPPEIDVGKEPEDPVVCVDDPVRFWGNITNSGDVPITDVRLTDIYDTTYLESLNDPAFWGPDDGELTHRFDLSAFPMGPGLFLGGLLNFRARAETSSTVDELRAVANDDPATEHSDTAEVAILPEPGPCEGNLVVNGGFEEGWAGWVAGLGAPRIEPPAHAGASSLRLGILPGVDMARTDIAYQDVTIPADAHDASLSFWYNVDNDGDADIRFNSFVAHVIDHVTGASHRVVDSVDSGGWQPATFDLTPFIGQTVRVTFGVTNDGDGTGPLWAYVDDVEICTSHCGPPEPPPDGPPPGPGPDQPPLTCWYWKAGWPDYAPNGVPDFDQKGPAVETAPTIAK
ncbi:MAG: DNRLRE domain-containing protein, partial [Anaerolineae bacterium]